MQPGWHSQHRRTKGRGDTSDRGLEELDDAGPEHRQVAAHFRGMRRNDAGRDRHAHGGKGCVNAGALAVQRLAAIRPFAVVGRPAVQGYRTVCTGVSVRTRHRHNSAGLMAMAWHGVRLGSSRCRGNLMRMCGLGNYGLGSRMRRRCMGQRCECSLPQQQHTT